MSVDQVSYHGALQWKEPEWNQQIFPSEPDEALS